MKRSDNDFRMESTMLQSDCRIVLDSKVQTIISQCRWSNLVMSGVAMFWRNENSISRNAAMSLLIPLVGCRVCLYRRNALANSIKDGCIKWIGWLRDLGGRSLFSKFIKRMPVCVVCHLSAVQVKPRRSDQSVNSL